MRAPGIPAPRPLPPPERTGPRAREVLAALGRAGREGFSGAALARAFERLGPTFVKLGQLIASSPGLFPHRFVEGLGRCRDRVAPLPGEEVLGRARASLGADPFARFDLTPLSSASVAQVHTARLRTGEEVVVKVRRPGVERVVATDLAILERATGALERLWPRTAGTSAREVLRELRRTITEELDFRVEAAYQARMREVLRACGGGWEVVAPALHPELCTDEVIVMERLEGFLLDDADAVRASGLQPLDLLHHAVRTVQETAIVHGLFHGDLHSANLLVLRDGRLGYVDFGIMGYLQRPARLALGRFFAGMLFEDYPFVVDSLVELGTLPPDVDRRRLVADLRRGAGRIFAGGLTGWELAPLIRLALRLAVRYRARLPRDVVLLAKQLLYLDGAARALAPGADLMAEAVEILLYFHHRYPELADELLPPWVAEELAAGGPDAVRGLRAGAGAARQP